MMCLSSEVAISGSNCMPVFVTIRCLHQETTRSQVTLHSTADHILFTVHKQGSPTSDHGYSKARSRSQQGTVTVTVTARYGHGHSKARSRQQQGTVTVTARFGHGHSKVRSQQGKVTVTARHGHGHSKVRSRSQQGTVTVTARRGHGQSKHLNTGNGHGRTVNFPTGIIRQIDNDLSEHAVL